MHPAVNRSTATGLTVRNHLREYPYTFRGGTSVGEVVADLRARSGAGQMVVYIFVVDAGRRLEGVVAMRELLLARPEQNLESIMLRSPYRMVADMPLEDAMRDSVGRHFPVYPVCDAEGVFLGIVRGSELFEQQAIRITAQAGEMVGVDAEERINTSTSLSLRNRHPWLQVNLLTCFVSAAVVHQFEDIIGAYVVLAVFLPVMTGQAINIGCQSLAVTLRGMTLGEVETGSGLRLVRKEAILGFLNGAFSGLTAAIGIFVYATMKSDPNRWDLAAIMFLAMTIASLVSGLSGALVPLALKRLGADPANASSIFLTTLAEVAALVAFLWLARIAFA